MKLLFATDHRFEIAPDGTVCTVGGKYPYSLWRNTYLEVFDEIVVVGRGGPMPTAADRLSVSSGPRVRHELVGGRRGWRRLIDLGAQAAAIRKRIDDVDAVIARLPGEIALSACTAARSRDLPHMVEVVASAWDGLWGHGSVAARGYAPVFEARTRSVTARAPVATYVTERFLQGRYPTRGQAFAVSDVTLRPSASDRIALRSERLTGKTRPIVFGTIGSLVSKMKGVHIAIAALAAAEEDLPPFLYRVLGEGDPEPYARQAREAGIGDRVVFDGVLPAGEPVDAWLNEIDIYLQPSFQEGLPRALVEALNGGCIAIGSTCGGIPELLPPDRLHPPGDVDALCTLLIATANQPIDAMLNESERSRATARRYHPDALFPRRMAALGALADMAAAKATT